MRVCGLRPSVRQLVGQKEALTRPHVRQALQLSGARVRQVVHAPVLAAQAHEGARRGRGRLSALRQRRRRLLLGGQRQRYRRRCQPPRPDTSPARPPIHTSPSPPRLYSGQTRKPQRQIPQSSRPKTLRKTARAAAPQSTSPHKYRW